MPRKPRDIEAELKALQERARSLRFRQKTQYGELILTTGADALSIEARRFAARQYRPGKG